MLLAIKNTASEGNEEQRLPNLATESPRGKRKDPDDAISCSEVDQGAGIVSESASKRGNGREEKEEEESQKEGENYTDRKA